MAVKDCGNLMGGLFYVKEAERSFKYTDHFIDWGFCRACNLCMSGLQDTSQGLCYAVGAMVHRYFALWHIYDCPFDNSHYHKADSLEKVETAKVKN